MGKKRDVKVVCGDISSPMIDAVKERIEGEGWKGCEARVLDAQVWMFTSVVSICCSPGSDRILVVGFST